MQYSSTSPTRNAWRINGALGTGGRQDTITINPLDQYQIFQANLNFKF
jgi:hypothetical protein